MYSVTKVPSKSGNLATWRYRLRCVETQISGFSFGLVSRLLKNGFRFQFCLCTASVSGFQFRLSYIQESCFILSAYYLNPLLLGVFVLLR